MADWISDLPAPAQAYLEGRRLDEVECLVADLAGVARGKAMPATKFATQPHFYLPNSIFLQTITGDWVDDGSDFTEPDMILRPDLSTATAAPWTGDWTLQIIHDCIARDGSPVPTAPRNVLRRVVDLYNARGWKPIVAPEMEFFLVARNTDPNQPVEPPMGRSGRRAAARQAYSMSAVDEYGPVIDDIYDFAEAQGFEIDGILQEGGAGQVEINLRHGDPVKLADEIFADVPGYLPPQAGFFLWLPVGDSEDAALKAWTETGVRVLPGAYLGRDAGNGNPGAGYIRVAMVAPIEDVQRGLTQLRDCIYG